MNNEDNLGSIDITEEQRLSLRRAARNSEYHLLLGAGASMDSTSRLGNPLPGSSALIEQLCVAFNVPAEEGDLLWRIYDRSVQAAGEARVYSWLKERFWGVKHSYWMEYYARSPWNIVWTLNIDDTFESAYRAIAQESSRQLETLNWDSDFRQSRNLNVIHLHGVVDTIPPRKLVFSLSEYAGSAASRAAWPANFHDVYGNSPFVILGARMRDEPDIEAVVSGRRPTHSAPSFYVARSISRGMRLDLERWGLVPVEMTAEDFVLAWGEMTGLDLEQELGSEMELAMRVGQQFVELKSTRVASDAQNHDFLGGDEPRWIDVQDGLAAELEWVTKAKQDCGQIGQSLSKSTALVYTGRRLTGRSTGLLQLGHYLRMHSWRTFLFQHKGRIDIDAILSFAADGKAVALLFDGVADFADDLNQLVIKARGLGASIVCVAVDDSNREAKILGRLDPASLAHRRVASINGRLTGVDSARLVDNLNKVGRLGILESCPPNKRISHFKGKDLFDAMAQLENAPGFGLRVGHLINDLNNAQKQKTVFLAAYASFVDSQILLVDISRMLGLTSDQMVGQIQDDPQISSLLSTDGTIVRTRHRFMALAPLVNKIGSVQAGEFLKDAIHNVSGRLNPKSLQQRNPTSQLVNAFMIQRNLREAIPGADLDSWYASLLDVFGSWSARYWEQRAILARNESRSDATLLAKAESFAMRATGLVADTYSFTTLGTVLLEKAATPPYGVAEYFQRGLEAFELAAEMDRGGGNIVTWTAFLRRSIRVLRRIESDVNSHSELPDHKKLWGIIRSQWEQVYAQMRTIRNSGEQTEKDLQRLQIEYHKLPITLKFETEGGE
ncbi:hypothetical protein CKW39_15165 [Kocuria sp. WRN011]|uniref:P-loop NTPase n=1 Tax=Kocuria sp. WRN011 TaxID=2029858 RepID=UPI000BAFD16A|nr:SIR2 family protein [Kocuria sp. WRN011]PBB07156.1 hypothetical protein CKW39_15165 [Kocuria sp. WRN011]